MEDSEPSWHGEVDVVFSEDGETNVNQSLECPHGLLPVLGASRGQNHVPEPPRPGHKKAAQL